MARNRLLVTYDVCDDSRRTSVYQVMRDFGDHVQFSVFLCDLNARELLALKRRLREHIHGTEDQVLFVDMGPAEGGAEARLAYLGRSLGPPTRVRVV